MEETFSGVKVDEILADFFVRKYDGKLEESHGSSASSNHSSGSIKENSKKPKKKKKKKHKSKKSKHKYSSRRSSRSPKRSEKHQSRSSDSHERDRSRSPRSRSHRSKSPWHSGRPQRSSKHKSGSPKHSSKYRSSSASHSDRSISRHSRKSKSRSTSRSGRSRSPRSRRNFHTSRELKSPEKNRSKGTDSTSKSKKEELNQIKDEKHSKQKTAVPENDPKSPIVEHSMSGGSPKKVDVSLNSTTEVHDECLAQKHCNYIASNSADTQSVVGDKTENSFDSIETQVDDKCIIKPLECGALYDKKESQDNKEVNCSNVPHDRNQTGNWSSESNTGQTVIDTKSQLPMNVDDAKIPLQGDANTSNSKSNADDPTQAKTKIVIQDLKSSSFVKTLYDCDNIELPPDYKPNISSDNVSESVNNGDESEEEKSKELFPNEKRCRSPSESSGKTSDSDQKSSPQEKKKRKHSKDKKHKRSKEKKHKKKKKAHSKERSVSPRKSEGREKIDKARLLKVARKNVLSMLEKGTLPQGISLENLRHEQLISIKAGGKSVQELTEFCQALSKKEGDDDGDNGNKEDTKNDDDSDQPFIHHPFKLKEQSVITMNIKNATQLPVKTHAEKVAENARLSLQFPVSSGSQHRQKEMEWVPVEKDDKKSTSTTEKKVAPKPSIKDGKRAVENVVEAPVTQAVSPTPAIETTDVPPQPSVHHPLPPAPPPAPPPPPPPPPPPSFPTLSLMPSSYPVPGQFLPCETSMAVNLPHASSHGSGQIFQTSAMQNLTSYGMASSFMPAVPPPAPVVNTFPVLSAKNIDLSAVVADRLKAVRKLQENPNDPEGLSILQQSQQKLQAWVQSQQVPGRFTGSTDAKLLSARELSGPNPMWARKDSLARAAPVTGGKGMSLMKKMGWNPGEGLGKNKEGALEPLVLDIKMDKKGLVSQGEEQRKKPTIAYCHKHPVSVLAELCAKRKWSPPLYTLLKEAGPSHKRLFLFKVNVNNVEYQPKDLCANKKLAKAQAAVLCLNAVGVAPSEYIMPS